MKRLIKLALNAAAGAAALIVLSHFGFALGLTPFNLAVSAVLGLPGVALLVLGTLIL